MCRIIGKIKKIAFNIVENAIKNGLKDCILRHISPVVSCFGRVS